MMSRANEYAPIKSLKLFRALRGVNLRKEIVDFDTYPDLTITTDVESAFLSRNFVNVDEWLHPKPDKKPESIPSVFFLLRIPLLSFAGRQLTSYRGGKMI